METSSIMKNFLFRLLILVLYIIWIPIVFIWIIIAVPVLGIFCILFWLFTGKNSEDFFLDWATLIPLLGNIISKIENKINKS